MAYFVLVAVVCAGGYYGGKAAVHGVKHVGHAIHSVVKPGKKDVKK